MPTMYYDELYLTAYYATPLGSYRRWVTYTGVAPLRVTTPA
ncbi:hypothetical protein SAMN02745181_3733 [Rubritalea squalenifaciens DSM 18772]|uniref:Uncharacterized protein n=1 Tax=Rubritalea squalenifaciens DSM 18772 TaxID=1123071 RepID=A0A1M6S669_9BACT|nr:hypothetical protein SAMN02745181_3733 [Rubritalea squalenifaciens DSM 18772]